MFTGLVQAAAEVVAIRAQPPGKLLVIRRGSQDAAVGDSIAVSGCCLTVVEVTAETLSFEAGPETLHRTNLGRLNPGDLVNLEHALRIGDPLGGHFVTGHIDGLASVESRIDEGEWSTLAFKAPRELMGQIVSKGSVALDGVSLTVVDVAQDSFRVQLIPHTLAVTTLGRLRPGDIVNLETDLLAKHVERQLSGWRALNTAH